ncbi:MAG TPA: 2-oxoacid:acceptor oxidoreductase subunit alpha [Candidatus Bathyarchaeia archaeon]|nr:2-oxoacid:acceptor oxidoreductase subunit alpha [Candidatus Bathyarchaeia archaeon]
MVRSFVNILIGGKAGEGVKVTGLILAKTLSRLGYSTFSYQEYPSLIRGGHNSFQIHASLDKAFSQLSKVDLLLAYDQATLKIHQKELNGDSLIIYDPDDGKPQAGFVGKYESIPMNKIALKNGNPLMANSVALGAALQLIGLSLGSLKNILKESFSNKGDEVVLANQRSSQEGFDYAKRNYAKNSFILSQPITKNKRMVITGNEALALGALAGGLKFYTSYPMTPATSILHYLASKAEKANIIVKQPEDEIGAVNQAVGASFVGVRTMTATSGGGFCLMTEGLGLSGITEIPIVIVNSMRPGPASGMPTLSGQGDLQFMIHAAQDNFPRIVLAPGDAEECFKLAKKSFYLAEKFQVPVIILMDKNISESYYSNPPFKSEHQNARLSFTKPKKGFLRYKLTENGVSPRCLVGEKYGTHLCNSYEHDQYGLATDDAEQRTRMMDKRSRKFNVIKHEMPLPKIYGNPQAKKSLISWGSNKGPILEALKNLPQINFLHLSGLWPFPAQSVKNFIENSQKVFSLECNSAGELACLIREQTGIKIEKMLKYDGRPFYPEKIVKKFNHRKRE